VGNPHRAGGYSSSGLKGLLTERTADRIEHAYIEGGTLATAIFTFDNVTPDRFLDPSLPPEEQALNLEMRIRAYRAHKGVISEVLEGSYTIEHPDPRVNRRSEAFRFSVNEYNVDEQFIPIVMLPDTGSELPVDENGQELEELNLFDHLSEDGKIKIVIRCENTGQYIGMTKSDVYLRRAESSFEWNLTKAFISIWLQMVMIISFGVMFSTRLNGAVSMVSTMSLVLMGLSSEMIFEIRHYMDRGDEMGGGPIESLIRLVRQDSMTTQLHIGGVAERIVKTFDTIIVYLMDAYATSLPNLPQMFQTSEYAAGGYDIFNDLLLRHSTATLGYFVAAVVIGYFFLKTREIAAQ
ncbi:MAG: ABC transporter permease, partial [Planctomycetota bacterium]